MKIGFQFVPFPREIWEQSIDLSKAEFRLLGWFLSGLRLGFQQLQFSDEQLLSGCEKWPRLGLSRNSMKEARESLVGRGMLVANQVSKGTWTYSVPLSENDTLGVNPRHYKCQTLTVGVSDSDTAIRNIEKAEETDSTLSSPPVPTGQFELNSELTPSPRKKKQTTADPRHRRFIELIFKAHEHFVRVPALIGPAAGKNLAELLRLAPALTEKRFIKMLENYHESDDHARADSPAYYIMKLPNYELGPKNKWGREEEVMGIGQ